MPAHARPTIEISRKTLGLTILAVVLVTAGIISMIVALNDQHHAPSPSRRAVIAPVGPTSAALSSRSSPAPASSRRSPSGPGRHATGSGLTVSTPSAGPHASLPPGDGRLRLPTSAPIHLGIPAIAVSSALLRLGLNPDQTVQIPALSQVSTAGWYKFSPTPGEAGSSVMLGHVDSAAYGPGVFFRLGALQPGDEVDVLRADGVTAVFRVDRVAEYPKAGFPARKIYVPTSYPSLKLVTCGGRYDSTTGNYLDNIVAFATLVSSRR